MDAVAVAAAAYARAGYFTVVDGILGPRWFYPPMRDALKNEGCRVGYAILRPRLDVALSRARGRSSETLSDPDVIENLWEGFDGLDASLDRCVFDTRARHQTKRPAVSASNSRWVRSPSEARPQTLRTQ